MTSRPKECPVENTPNFKKCLNCESCSLEEQFFPKGQNYSFLQRIKDGAIEIIVYCVVTIADRLSKRKIIMEEQLQPEPTNCDKCKVSLEGAGYTCHYKGNRLVGALCFKCERDRELQEYIQTKILRSHFITNITLDLDRLGSPWNYQALVEDPYNGYNKSLRRLIDKASVKEFTDFHHKVIAFLSYLKICEKIKEFEDKVWFNGLQKIIQASDKKGVSAHDGKFKVLTFSMCARTMITIEDKNASVTLMTTEDSSEHHMHFRGIDATEEQAIALIDRAISLYNSNKLKFKDDSKVSYCGI